MTAAKKREDCFHFSINSLQQLKSILEPMEDIIDHWPQVAAVVSQEREALEMEVSILILAEEQLWWWALGKSKLDVKMREEILELGNIKVSRNIFIGNNEPIATNSNDICQ